MLHNAPDVEHFDENIWMDDLLSEVHNDDRLWGYMIRISEQLHRHIPGEYGDEVLYRLLCMGVFDWQHEDHRTNALTQAMRHSTAMVHWVIDQIKQVETMVSCLLISACWDLQTDYTQLRDHMAAEEIAMGNIQTIWSAVADEVNRMVENQKVAVRESVSAIEELRRQMMSARADLEEADQRMDCHRAVLAKHSSLFKRLEQHQSFTADRVTVLEDTWGKGKFSKYSALLERLDKQDDVIQDLKEQVAILQGNRCRCFDAGLGSSADAEGELDYEGDKDVEVQPPWSSNLPMLTRDVV